MGINVEDKKNAIDLLEKYSGNNPYLLNLKKDFFNGKTSLNDLVKLKMYLVGKIII